MTPRPGRTRTGRTALTPDVQKRICDVLLLGADYATAADYGGITYSAFRVWMRKGEAGERPFVTFVAAVKKASSESVVRHLAQIEEAATARVIACKAVVKVDGKCEVCGEPFHVERRCRNSIEVPGQWTAAAWKLERRHPDRFGQRQRIEVANVSAEDLIALMSELAHVVVSAGVSDEQREQIAAGWMEIARRRGLSPSSEVDDVADRVARTRLAQAKLPGTAP